MFYFSNSLLDALLQSDIEYGDLTTRALNIGQRHGTMSFIRRRAGRVSGVELAQNLSEKLSLAVQTRVKDGEDVAAGAILLSVRGRAEQLHQGWKIVQNVLEWSCGVAQYMAEMTASAGKINPVVRIACTRKSIPGTKPLAIMAVMHGGGILHRAGTSETILLFANHRRFWTDAGDWRGMIDTLRANAPEKKIIVEADTPEEAKHALAARPDVLQLDKFSPSQLTALVRQRHRIAPHCLLSAAGGVNKNNIAQYAQTGVDLIITSAPYYAPPEDIKVVLVPV